VTTGDANGPLRPVAEGGELGREGCDVAIVGLGRVGLPLALAFADRGLRVLGIDNDPGRLAALRARTMPFRETGAQALLERVEIHLSDEIADAAAAEHIVITLGTPSFSHIEIDMSQIRAALDALRERLRPGHSLILRSTVAPGTTDFAAGYLRRHTGLQAGRDIHVAHAPERIAAGRFLEEIVTLPCIESAFESTITATCCCGSTPFIAR